MIPLLPDALASSIIITVWVGVLFSVFFALRFGWTLSGLVVPGYLTPLLLIKPLSAAVVFAEGLVTYWLVHLLSERLSRFGGWSSLFGRDRFFALVLVSVVVRLLGDGWLLPEFGEWWNRYFHQNFDYRSDLHSFGLIVVSLIANQFWKTGVCASLAPLMITIGLTCLAVRYGLMEFTNFDIGSLRYTYDDLAASLLTTPKAYIILLTTAWIASRMNLHYGWEFNGILIPSLLALQWYDPIRILTSFTEAFIILGLARGLLTFPAIARLHLEGPRALLFFFNIAFAYKLALGWGLPQIWPMLPITDAYGFGYLLTTLIALRMHEKEIAARLTRATLQTSLIAVGVASLAGFMLTLLPGTPMNAQRPEGETVSIVKDERTLTAILSDSQVELNRPRAPGSALIPLPRELEAFRSGIEQLRVYLDTANPAALTEAVRRLDAAHYQMDQVEQRYLYLRERTPINGWGIYVLDTQAPGHLLIEVPAPFEERGAMQAGGGLFRVLQGRALAIAGAWRTVNPDRSLDVLSRRQTFFQAFHEVMARR
ncbi:MAG TPA: poly-gamma-glutamate biosynthesis protein PgsC/CapC, partial [Candidatus Competibacteraceae bacterium]|nr:poly-gamma-glutamate biosynthesis protein PgsC/CapC [Candidatus Competibacteraceae bacterium]